MRTLRRESLLRHPKRVARASRMHDLFYLPAHHHLMESALAHAGWFATLLLPLMLMGYAARTRLPALTRSALLCAAVAVCVVLVFRDASIIAGNVARPPEWDLQWFWIEGRAAVLHGNFYRPETAAAIASGMHASAALQRELLFWYPPATMLGVAPLGWTDLRHATALWYMIQVAALVADIALLRALFLPHDRAFGYAVAGVAVLGWPATTETIAYGQTNLVVLLCVLLALRAAKPTQSGVWLAVSMAVKPWTALLGIWFLLRKRWAATGAAIVTTGALTGAAALAFGWETTTTYFTDNPVVHAPPSLFVDPITQSLNAVFLRSLEDAHLVKILFVVIAVMLTVSTFSLLLCRRASDAVELSVIMVLALLVYPATLAHYSVLLLLPIFAVWNARHRIGGPWVAATAIFAIAVLTRLHGDATFLALTSMWLIAATALYRADRVPLAIRGTYDPSAAAIKDGSDQSS